MIHQNQQEIHGHEVLEMMANSGQSYTRASLVAAIEERFGGEAKFYICAGGGMTAAELVEALAERGKFVGSDDAFVFDPATRCDHG